MGDIIKLNFRVVSTLLKRSPERIYLPTCKTQKKDMIQIQTVRPARPGSPLLKPLYHACLYLFPLFPLCRQRRFCKIWKVELPFSFEMW